MERMEIIQSQAASKLDRYNLEDFPEASEMADKDRVDATRAQASLLRDIRSHGKDVYTPSSRSNETDPVIRGVESRENNKTKHATTARATIRACRTPN